MDDHLERHLRDLYGLNPDMPHMAFQFPRLPPLARHGLAGPTSSTQDRLGAGEDLARADFARFQDEFRQKAMGLLTGSGPMPPAHPLNNSRRLVNKLMAENDKLQKENQDLRDQLAKMDQDKAPRP